MSDVAAVFALSAEQGCFEDLLAGVVTLETPAGKVRRGKLGERSVTTIVAGAGRAATARACETIIQGDRPQWLISAGFCGGLTPNLRRYDVVVADRLLAESATSIVPDGVVRAGLQLPDAERGSFVTVDRIIARSADKRELGKRTGAAVCEMESFAAGEVCAAHGVPLLAIRVVTDPVDEDLPPDLDRLLRQKSTAGTIGAALGTLWQRPSSIKDLWRLKEQALVAADNLAKFLAEVIARLPQDRLLSEP